MSRSLTPATGNPQRPPRPEEAGSKGSLTKQWKLRSDQSTQENIWVPSVEHTGSFPYRNSWTDGQPIPRSAPGSTNVKPSTIIIPQRQDSIAALPNRASDVGSNYQLGQGYKPSQYRYSYSAQTDDSLNSLDSIDSSNFSMELRRSGAQQSWDVFNSPNLNIIDSYADEEPPRPLPSVLPPILPPVPDLAPPSSRAYNARSPRNLDELEARNSILTTNTSHHDSVRNQGGIRLPSNPNVLPPILKASNERKVSSGIRTSGHQKTHSQARLLPLHANAPPTLTRDKPTGWQSHNPISDDLVTIYWIIFAGGFLFPPFWLMLGFGMFDALLNMPEKPGPKEYEMVSLTKEEKKEIARIRRIKLFAILLGVFFWLLCLAGILVGLLLRPNR